MDEEVEVVIIDFSDCGLTADSLSSRWAEIAADFPSPRKLSLNLSHNRMLSRFDPAIFQGHIVVDLNVRATSLANAFVVALLLYAPNLRSLDISDLDWDGPDVQRVMAALPNSTVHVTAHWNRVSTNDRVSMPQVSWGHQRGVRGGNAKHYSPNIPVSRFDKDAFLQTQCGFLWGDLVVPDHPFSQLRSSIEGVADTVIAQIPGWMLESSLRKSVAGRAVFVKLKLAKFGSCVNGLGAKRSDVDLVVVPVDSEGEDLMHRQFSSPETQKLLSQDFLYWLRRMLENDELIVEYIAHARIPLLRIPNFPISRTATISVDITFMNAVCVINSAFIRACATASEDLFALAHCVKLWTKTNSLVSSAANAHSFPSSYAWTLIVLFFLQERQGGDRYLREQSEESEEPPAEPVWGCRNAWFVRRRFNAPTHRSGGRNLVSLFFEFLEFLRTDACHIRIDLLRPELPLLAADLTVIDPIELDRLVTKNVDAGSLRIILSAATQTLLTPIRTFSNFTDLLTAPLNLMDL